MKKIELSLQLYGSSVLRKKAKEVDIIDSEIESYLDEMLKIMYKYNGIGLAANQAGLLKKLVVIDLGRSPLKLINPRIVKRSGKVEFEEGCLSLPGLRVKVKRSAEVLVEALDTKGHPLKISAQGLLAICLQHEIDHLEGRLILDYLPFIKRVKEKRKLMEVVKNVKLSQQGEKFEKM